MVLARQTSRKAGGYAAPQDPCGCRTRKTPLNCMEEETGDGTGMLSTTAREYKVGEWVFEPCDLRRCAFTYRVSSMPSLLIKIFHMGKSPSGRRTIGFIYLSISVRAVRAACRRVRLLLREWREVCCWISKTQQASGQQSDMYLVVRLPRIVCRTELKKFWP
jgi:hypothetical protein